MIYTADLVNMPVGVAAGYAVMGFAVVFFGLILLMIVIKIMGAITLAMRSKTAVSSASKVQESAPVQKKPAPGSAGELKLYNTSARDAAMIMAIVANKMQKPLNELRFISIREVK